MRRLFSYRDARLLVAGGRSHLRRLGDVDRDGGVEEEPHRLERPRRPRLLRARAGNLAGPLGGLLADRVRRRPLMIATDCTLGGSVLLLLFVHDKGDAWLIYFIALLYGVGGTVFYPARAAVLRLMLPEDLLADANGVLSSTQQGLRIIAPLVGASFTPPWAEARWPRWTQRRSPVSTPPLADAHRRGEACAAGASLPS
jgi:MFS transporter